MVKLAINVVIGLKEDKFKATVKMPVQLGGGEINVKDIDAAFMERHGWKEEEQEEPLDGEGIAPGHEVGEDIPAEDEQMQVGEGIVLGQEVGEDIVAGDEQMQESDDVVPGSQIGEDITAVDDRMQE